MRWLIAPFLATSLLIVTARAQSLPEPQIWFNPHSPLSSDMMNLWADDAPWTSAASNVKVLVLVDWWVRQPANTAQLTNLIAFAAKHHMQLDLDVEPVQRLATDTCGQGEGYDGPGDVAWTVHILADLGARLDWIDMDEPMWFGHYDTDPAKCQLAISDVISRTALSMKDALAIYPNLKIMDEEPMPALTEQANWQQDMTAFYMGLSQQLGTPIRSLMLDVGWEAPDWKPGMQAVHTYTQEHGMGFAVILNSDASNTTDAAWINSAINNFETIEGTLHIIPDQMQFTTWDLNPQFNLPETSPTTLTWLINRYVRPLTELQVQFVGQGAHGKLTTATGKPIPNATINGFKPGVNYSQPLPVTVSLGVVPAGAVYGIIIMRVNTECSCDGLNDLLFGVIQYQETAGGSVQSSLSYPWSGNTTNGVLINQEVVGGIHVTRLIAQPGLPWTYNGNWFAVTPGAQYQLSVPAATVGGLGWNGIVGIVWIGANNGEISRSVVTPGPGKALLSTAVTAADGTFTLFPMPRSVDGPNPVTVEFDGGGGNYRSTVWTPLR